MNDFLQSFYYIFNDILLIDSNLIRCYHGGCLATWLVYNEQCNYFSGMMYAAEVIQPKIMTKSKSWTERLLRVQNLFHSIPFFPCFLASLLACILACLPACLLACILACLLACLLLSIKIGNFFSYGMNIILLQWLLHTGWLSCVQLSSSCYSKYQVRRPLLSSTFNN